MASLILYGTILATIAAAIWLAWRTGRTAAQKDVIEDVAKIKEKQLAAVLDKPTKPRLIDELRAGRF